MYKCVLFPLFLVCMGLFAGSGFGQVTITGKTGRSFKVDCLFQKQSLSKSLPPSTPITSSVNVSVSLVLAGAKATVSIGSNGNIAATWGAGKNYSGYAASATSSSEVLLHMGTRAACSGRLVGTCSFSAYGGGSVGAKILAQPKVLYLGVGSRKINFPVTIPSTGRTVTVNCYASASPTTMAVSKGGNGRMSFRFQKETEVYGKSCSSLNGDFGGTNTLRLTTSGGPRSGFGISLIGIQKTQTSTPFPGCLVLTQPLVAFGSYVLDKNGAGQHALPFPPGSWHVLIQDFQLVGSGANLIVKLTNGLEVWKT